MHNSAQNQRAFSLPAALRARHIALPNEHGAWVFLLSPLAIGLAAGGLKPASLLLTVAALAAFLARQPVTVAVKALSGRRPKSELPAAAFWLALYGAVLLASLIALVAMGYFYLLYLAVPAAPVFGWHLWLVSRRAERRQLWVEIFGAGALALAAPAALWVGRGGYDPTGWVIWGLAWLQVTGTILHAYLRLQQRVLKHQSSRDESFQMAGASLAFNTAAFVLVAVLALVGALPRFLPLAFAIQPLETLWGALHPAVGVKPTRIGVRQLIVSILFTVVFILAWLAG